MILDPNNLEATQLEMLQNVNAESREMIATVVLIMYDTDSARLLLQHYSTELKPTTVHLLSQMLAFEAEQDAADAAAATKH
jgi:hypothetical protein